jgi:hypothetical protein
MQLKMAVPVRVKTVMADAAVAENRVDEYLL